MDKIPFKEQLVIDEFKDTYVLDKIPFKEQLVIDELVELWQTRHGLPDLLTHIAGTWKPGGGKVTWFFAQVHQDLRTDNRSKYGAFSAFEFRKFLEGKFRRLDQLYTEGQAQIKEAAEAARQAEEKVKAERQAQASADFDVLGKEMANETTRVALVELGRKRADLAPFTGVSYSYKNHCWNCHNSISSDIHARCPVCMFYICSSCSSCLCEFNNYRGEKKLKMDQSSHDGSSRYDQRLLLDE